MLLSLFSVSYAGLWGQRALDTAALIAKAAELGYDAVMLMGKRPHLSPLDATPHEVAAIKNVAKCQRKGGWARAASPQPPSPMLAMTAFGKVTIEPDAVHVLFPLFPIFPSLTRLPHSGEEHRSFFRLPLDKPATLVYCTR